VAFCSSQDQKPFWERQRTGLPFWLAYLSKG